MRGAAGAGRYYAIAIKGFNGGGRGVCMAIGYEVNPPRLPEGAEQPRGNSAERLLEAVNRRVADMEGVCDFVHVTESVLGTRRISPIAAARSIRMHSPGQSVTVTMRTRERSEEEALAFAGEARSAGIGGILIVMGDPLRGDAGRGGGRAGRGPALAPSRAAGSLRGAAGARGVDLFLSVPGRADAAAAPMRAKIAARPAGFFTQVVASVGQVTDIHALLAPMGFRVVPIVLVPSAANKKSAALLGIDWSGYERDAAGFIRGVHDAAGDVLVTSPNDFSAALDALGSV